LKKRSEGRALARRDQRDEKHFAISGLSSASDTSPTRRCFPARSISTTTATSAPPATCWLSATASSFLAFCLRDVQDRRYRQAITAAGSAAWRLWKRRNFRGARALTTCGGARRSLFARRSWLTRQVFDSLLLFPCGCPILATVILSVAQQSRRTCFLQLLPQRVGWRYQEWKAKKAAATRHTPAAA